jgi:HAD superfamily hydrolase (TIGR01450 family)
VTDLLARHDVLLVDLDGTLYRGPAAVPGAVEAVVDAAGRGVRIVYVTNNAARSPSDVAAHLAELGFPAGPGDVVTSAQAGAALLAEQLDPGAPVLVVGTEALADEVRGVGLAVTDRGGEAVAVVQGHSETTGWALLAEAAVALRSGALWVACNLDPILPTERGPLPGNGAMVAALRIVTGREPQVAGKPAATLLLDGVRRTGARSALMIGDRLDTDVQGGRAARLTTLLVLTGITDAAELLAAPPGLRPDLVGADLGALRRTPEELTPGPRPGWTVDAVDGHLALTCTAADAEPMDALLALAGAHWARGGGPTDVCAADDAAAAAVRTLGLGAVGCASVILTGADRSGR